MRRRDNQPRLGISSTFEPLGASVIVNQVFHNDFHQVHMLKQIEKIHQTETAISIVVNKVNLFMMDSYH